MVLNKICKISVLATIIFVFIIIIYLFTNINKTITYKTDSTDNLFYLWYIDKSDNTLYEINKFSKKRIKISDNITCVQYANELLYSDICKIYNAKGILIDSTEIDMSPIYRFYPIYKNCFLVRCGGYSLDFVYDKKKKSIIRYSYNNIPLEDNNGNIYVINTVDYWNDNLELIVDYYIDKELIIQDVDSAGIIDACDIIIRNDYIYYLKSDGYIYMYSMRDKITSQLIRGQKIIGLNKSYLYVENGADIVIYSIKNGNFNIVKNILSETENYHIDSYNRSIWLMYEDGIVLNKRL